MSNDPHCIEERALLVAIQHALPHLEALHHRTQGLGGQDLFYRFYRQSPQVYGGERMTAEIVAALRALAPHLPLHPGFLTIVAEAAGRAGSRDAHPPRIQQMRPLMEAFLHATTFLALVVHAGRTNQQLTAALPSAWGAVLDLFQIQ